MKLIAKAFLLIFLCVTGSHLFAFGNLTADKVRTLFSGNTTEGERREGIPPGLGPPNMTENYVEEFKIFFAENGTAKIKIGDKRGTGKWSVTDSGELCLKWKEKKKRCAPVYKSGKVYKRATKRRMGRVRQELVFIRFAPGNVHDL